MLESDIEISPNWNNFWVIPASCPSLRENITSAEWNHGNYTIYIQVKETLAFSVFEWLQRISSKPNHDLVAICFFDEEEIHEIARLEFRNLTLVDHKCILDKESNSFENDLIHEITFSYNTVVRIKSNETLESVYQKFDEDAVRSTDEEWCKESLEKVVVAES